MFYSKISVQSDVEVSTFKKPVVLPNGIEFDHFETIKQIGYHRMGMFYKNDDSDDIFYPLGMKREPHFAKKIGGDTKDYGLKAKGDNSVRKSWVGNIKLRRWMRDSNFAVDLKDQSEELASYGSEVKKRVPNGEVENDLKPCNLLYLYFDPTVAWIKDSPIIELHQLTEYQIRSMKGWRNIDEALKQAEKVDSGEDKDPTADVIDKYKVWERVGEYQRKDKKGNFTDKDPVYYHAIFCGYGETEVVLFDEVIKREDCPYFDQHISKYADRWLRVGVYERLFGLQGLVNSLVNMNREANLIASLLLFQSNNKALKNRNFLKEAVSGMILDQGLSQVPIDNRFLSGFLNELNQYERKADELCMTPDMVTGENLPANSTFRGQALLTNVANDAFDNTRDRIGVKNSEILLKFILPPEMNKWNKEDVMEIAGEEESKMFDMYAMQFKVEEFIATEYANDRIPTPQDIMEFKENLMKSWDMDGKKITDLKGFWDTDWGVEFNPTGENANQEQKNNVYANALPMLQNISPTGFNELLKQYLEDNGISPIKIPLQDLNAMAVNNENQTPAPKMDKLMSLVNP